MAPPSASNVESVGRNKNRIHRSGESSDKITTSTGDLDLETPVVGPLHEQNEVASRQSIANETSSTKKSGQRTESTVAASVTSSMKKDDSEVGHSITSSMKWVASYFQETSNNPHTRDQSSNNIPRAQQHGDDDNSVDAHFARTDFMPSNWSEASEYIPPIGFAVVAGGLCVMNPIVFVGGALTACTAVGAVHAAQNTYDACVDGNLCAVFASGQKEDHATILLSDEGRSIQKDLSGLTFTSSMDELVTPSELQDISTSQTNVNEQDLSAFESTSDALAWVDQVYPQLKCKSASGLKFPGLNAREFFDVFFADAAPYTFAEFQRKRKDKNVRYGQWEELDGVTQMSLVDAGTVNGAVNTDLNPSYHFRERVLDFDAKTNNGLLGPPYAISTKVQRCLVASKKLLVLEGKTTVKEIPFCDRFYVLERWVLTTEKSGDQYVSTLDVSCQVVFSKSCPFEVIITNKSQDSISEIALHWYEMATKALKKTEHARQMRLQEEERRKQAKESPDGTVSTQTSEDRSLGSESDVENIELERLDDSLTRILGDTDTVIISSCSSSSGTSRRGRPPMSRRRRTASLGRSLGRSITSLVKRRNHSTSDLQQLA